MKKISFNRSTQERFAYYSSAPDKNGCINWLGQKDKNGYGRIKPTGEKRMKAHRYSYKMFFGEIPEGYLVCHKCDNPSCVNPEHLFLGTPKENSNDRDKKGRTAKNNLEGLPMKMLPNSKLTKENVLEIRKLLNIKHITVNTIAEMFQVHTTTIYYIKKRKTWYHI